MNAPITYNFADLAGRFAAVAPKPKAQPLNQSTAEGGRNNHLMVAAGFYRRQGFDETRIVKELRRLNLLNVPPLADSEVLTIAKSAMRYPAEFACTDLGNLERVRAAHEADMRFNISLGQHRTWNGKYWQLDEGEVKWNEFIAATVLGIHDEAKAAAQAGDTTRHAALAKWAITSQSKQRRNNIVADLKQTSEIAFSGEKFDSHPLLFNCANGTLNLKVGEQFGLRPFNRDDLLTAGSDIVYDEVAKCPLWIEFLDLIFNGNRDIIRWVQKFCGYCMTGDIGEQIFTILWGSGSNGKSTFLSVLQAILGIGRYCCKLDNDLLIAYRDKVASCEIATLVGMRLAVGSEPKQGGILRIDRIKEWTGDDVVHAKALYENPFDFRRQFKLLLLTNHKPRLTETGEAVRRRIRLVPFTAQIPESNKKPNYWQTLLAKEASGILAWMVEGCRLWQEEGLKAPKEIVDASAEYVDQQDQVQQFITDRCEIALGSEVQAAVLYMAYNNWCKGSGCFPLSNKNFKERLMQLHSATVSSDRNSQGNVYRGIKLNQVTGVDDNLPFYAQSSAGSVTHDAF